MLKRKKRSSFQFKMEMTFKIGKAIPHTGEWRMAY